MDIELYGKKIEQVNRLKYLGIMINITENVEEEINERIKAANNVYYPIHKNVIGYKVISMKTRQSKFENFQKLILHTMCLIYQN